MATVRSWLGGLFRTSPRLETVPGRPAGPGAPIVALTLLWILLAVGNHVAWESSGGQGPYYDPHSIYFLSLALDSRDWLRGADHQEPRGFFPSTRDYPPLAFVTGGLALHLFEPLPEVARLSQVPFLAAFIALMARLGWQVAGGRGAALLGLAAAGCPWAAHYTREFCMVPGLLFSLALSLSLLLDTRGLTRPGACALLGLALGLGLLFKQVFLLLVAPVLLAAALPGLLSSAPSVRAGLLLLALLAGLPGLVEAGREQAALGPAAEDWTMVLAAESAFLFVLLATLLASRRGRWTPGAGLAVAACVAGMVCAPWYMAKLVVLEDVTDSHLLMAAQRWSLAPWVILRESLRQVHTFYWGGLLWLGLGTLLLLTWPSVRRTGLVLVAGFAGALALTAFVVAPTTRYLAPLVPFLLALSFLGLARWRATFVSGMAVLLALGVLQNAGWLASVRQATERAGVSIRLTGDLLGYLPWQRQWRTGPEWLIWDLPVAALRGPGPRIWASLEPGSRVLLVTPPSEGGHTDFEDATSFLAAFLARRHPLVRRADLGRLDQVQAVVLVSASREVPSAARNRPELLPAGRFKLRVWESAVYLHLFRTRGPAGRRVDRRTGLPGP